MIINYLNYDIGPIGQPNENFAMVSAILARFLHVSTLLRVNSLLVIACRPDESVFQRIFIWCMVRSSQGMYCMVAWLRGRPDYKEEREGREPDSIVKSTT
jgi:hypothetical protein